MASFGIIALKGNHLSNIDNVFSIFNYKDLNNDKVFNSIETLEKFLYEEFVEASFRDIQLKGVFLLDGWTLILDPELIDVFDSESLASVSERLKAKVFTFVAQSNSDTFAFAAYDNLLIRKFYSSEGIVEEEFGASILEEEGLNINEKIFTDDILNLMKRLGINLDSETGSNFKVKELAVMN